MTTGARRGRADGRRALAIHPGSLGDVLLAAPALAHLGARGYRVTLAAAARLAPLFAASELVEAAVDVETLALHRLFQTPPPADALDGLRAYDAVVSWLGAGDPAYRASLRQLGRPVVVAPAAPPDGRVHASRHLLDTLAPLGPVPASLPRPVLRAPLGEVAAARAWLDARGLAGTRVVVLQPGAGSPAKVWPGFASLARRLRAAGLGVVALAGPADQRTVASLVTGGAVDPDHVARDWPLLRVAALLGNADAMVGNDSGPTHLAAAVGCPTVAVFGPTRAETWAPVGAHVRVTAGGATWAAADVETVAAAVDEALGRGRPAFRAVAGGAA